jgi:O-antigen ligase
VIPVVAHRPIAALQGPATATAALIVAALAIWMSRVSLVAFGIAVLVLLGIIAVAAVRWPRATLVLVALSAILDRYIVAGLLPESLGIASHLFSEILLTVIGGVIAWRAWTAHRFIQAFRHPATVFLVLFTVLGLVATVVNRVPIDQAFAGLLFTLDAAALFYLARMVGFNVEQGLAAVAALVGLLFAAGVIAIIQALIRPDVLGLTVLIGRFGEAYRLASIFGDPNVFAALISATAPFAVMTAVHAGRARDRWLAIFICFVLVLPLWLSFSRGGWFGMITGFTIAALILDRRAWVVGIAVIAIAFGVAATMPRDLGGSPNGAKPPNMIGSTQERIGAVSNGKDLRTLFVANAIPILTDHPLVGVGPGMYGGAIAKIFGTPIYGRYHTDALFTNPQQDTVDDFWLHIAVEGGILGVLALAGAMLAVGVPVYRAARRARGRRRILLVGIAAAGTSLVLNSLTTMLLEANSVAFVFWFLLGIGSLLAEPAGSAWFGRRGAPQLQDDPPLGHDEPILALDLRAAS